MEEEASLVSLPTELLQDIHVLAINTELPLVSRRLNNCLKAPPTTVIARFLLNKHVKSPEPLDGLSAMMKHPICTISVLQKILEHVYSLPFYSGSVTSRQNTNSTTAHYNLAVTLPKRLFRDLSASSTAYVMALFDYLASTTVARSSRQGAITLHIDPDPNSHHGYPLIKAVQARQFDLVGFLLRNGADPRKRDFLAILVAIQAKDLALTQFLIEGDVLKSHRDHEIPVKMKKTVLKAAIKAGASDIVEWLIHEKGCIPDMEILRTVK